MSVDAQEGPRAQGRLSNLSVLGYLIFAYRNPVVASL